jgi:hypothetical protein
MSETPVTHSSPLTAEEIASVRKPYRAASLLPGRAYHDPAFFDFERERWFRRDWVVVGREEDAAAPGTYFLAEVDDEPLIVVRARDGVLRGFSTSAATAARASSRSRAARRRQCPCTTPDLRPRRSLIRSQEHRRPRRLQPGRSGWSGSV